MRFSMLSVAPHEAPHVRGGIFPTSLRHKTYERSYHWICGLQQGIDWSILFFGFLLNWISRSHQGVEIIGHQFCDAYQRQYCHCHICVEPASLLKFTLIFCQKIK